MSDDPLYESGDGLVERRHKNRRRSHRVSRGQNDDDMEYFQSALKSMDLTKFKTAKKQTSRRRKRGGGRDDFDDLDVNAVDEGGVSTVAADERLKARIEGIARNCRFEIDDIYASLTQSKEWGVRRHLDDVIYIYSKKKALVDSIPLASTSSVENVTTKQQEENDVTIPILGNEGEQAKNVSMSVKEESMLIKQKHIFVFSFGAIVVWGCAKGTARKVSRMLLRHESEVDLGSSGKDEDEHDDTSLEEDDGPDEMTPLTKVVTTRTMIEDSEQNEDEDDPHAQYDDMSYCFGVASTLKNDLVCLQTSGPQEKLAVSFAFAQSLKLSVFEDHVESTFDATKEYSRNLASSGTILNILSEESVSKAVGHLFTVKAEINLNAGILDTPDFFWENDKYEPLYNRSRKYLDLAKRLGVLEKKLDVIGNLLDVLQNQLTNEHANRLEWIIVVLIFIEVFIQIFWNIIIKDVLKMFPDAVIYAHK